MKQVALALILFTGTASASDTSVTLRDYIEALMREHDQKVIQQRQDDRLAIENALRSEIRIKDEESKSRYALKVEVNELRDRVAKSDSRIAELEGANVNVYIGIVILALLGFANLVKMLWGDRR